MSKYPEHERMKACRELTQPVGEFLEWLDEQGMMICGRLSGREEPRTVVQWLADWQDIDLVEIEKEKRAMLDELRGEQ